MWLTIMEDQKDVSSRAFNDWRAFTNELLSKSFKDEFIIDGAQAFIRPRAVEVMDVIWPWAIPETEAELVDSLCEIFAEAVRLSQFLRRQRACWTVRFPATPLVPESTAKDPQRTSLVFDPESMIFKDDYFDDDEIDPEQLRGAKIELVITPALYKRGNVDGENFDVEYPAVPAWVVVDLDSGHH
jgi:hypothetical protein